MRAWGLECGLGAWNAGLAQKPGPRGLGILVYEVKARAYMQRTGANPTIASYNASIVKTYSAVNSMVRF
jgi:hypothetical protein